MSVLADLFVSTEADATSYDGSQSLSDEDRVQGASLGTLELSTLWAILEDREWDVKLMNDFQYVLEEDDGERLIHQLPAAFLSWLVLSDPGTLKLATAQWAKTDEIACDPSTLSQLWRT